jgi:hypothetical protein
VKTKEIKTSTELCEDEKDPDVIPQAKKTEKPLCAAVVAPTNNYGEHEIEKL